MLDEQRADLRLEESQLILLLVIAKTNQRKKEDEQQVQRKDSNSWLAGHRQVSTGVRLTLSIIDETDADPQPLSRYLLFAGREGDRDVQFAIVTNNSDDNSISRLFALDHVLELVAR